MSPSDFISARDTLTATKTTPYPHKTVCNRPYFPTVTVTPTDKASITLAASLIVYYPSSPPPPENDAQPLEVTPVKGGITNALFRVSNFPSPHPSSILLRVFGAEGMIDRDDETHAYAALCDAGVGGEYCGRFQNGRVEGWLFGYRALEVRELARGEISVRIAERTKFLHENFEWHGEPGLWTQLFSWLEQAEGFVTRGEFKCEGDGGVAERLIRVDLDVGSELKNLKDCVIPKDARVSFCHNDLLAANIMVKEDVEDGDVHVQLIDFEYGGMNYSAFDIANHFNEFAGGTDDGKPNYDWFPSEEQQRKFLEVYLGDSAEECLEEFWEEVKAFIKVNHLYWGMWAVNQAAMEGCDEFNYLLYAENRFKRYREI
eukprot:CAMPEP_0172520894 /NCGR_PEP_ID=MMETSP1066-20121228/292262_1 /TAXON_ID=671091 /ORGANISM="Coscinodiscus wailesii, Strain CCMP2513" /LENGTH=372 /DNA_ID=CAMNT_0013303713 /DNA_START=56 /DNA_END=1174 /DNA_ORIENTATION=+